MKVHPVGLSTDLEKMAVLYLPLKLTGLLLNLNFHDCAIHDSGQVLEFVLLQKSVNLC